MDDADGVLASRIMATKNVLVDGQLRRVYCGANDRDADKWEVTWVGSSYSGSSIECDSLSKAERLARAFSQVFMAGMAEDERQIRTFLGIR